MVNPFSLWLKSTIQMVLVGQVKVPCSTRFVMQSTLSGQYALALPTADK
jgi:hypothetical protein